MQPRTTYFVRMLGATLALLAVPGWALADQFKKFGDFQVHYNAMLTEDLQPEVARAYKIDRSQNRGLITISVLKKNNLGVGQAVKAKVRVSSINMSAQLIGVDMREVQEGTAIYYLGEYRVSAPETLKFNVSVKPEGAAVTYTFDFQRNFY